MLLNTTLWIYFLQKCHLTRRQAGRKQCQEGNYRLPAFRLCKGVTGPSFCRRGHLPCCCDNRSLYIAEMLSAAGFSPDANGRKWAPTATKLITSFSSALLPFSFFLFLFILYPPPHTHTHTHFRWTVKCTYSRSCCGLWWALNNYSWSYLNPG